MSEGKEAEGRRGSSGGRRVTEEEEKVALSEMSAIGLKPRKYHSFTVGTSRFTLDTRYINLKPIGRGSYGIVVSAFDSVTGRNVAIKKISKVFNDLVDAKRILREIKLLQHLGDHENIIALYDLITYPAHTRRFRDLYIITELFECDLDRIVSSSQPLTDGHRQFFLYQILRGIKYIHSANVLHRDLKPLNLLVNANCDLSICDFGLARGVRSDSDGDDDKMTEYVVTRWYRAPELLCDNQTYDAKVDVWSIGCIFAEILVRKPMLKGKDYMHQLQLIIDLLGEQGRKDARFIVNPDARATVRAMRPRSGAVRFAERFAGEEEKAVDILSRMLVFNPESRAGVDELLAHPYLSEIHRDEDEPVCPKPFDYGFEKGYPEEMPEELLQEHMYKCMLSSRARDARYQTTMGSVASSVGGSAAESTGK